MFLIIQQNNKKKQQKITNEVHSRPMYSKNITLKGRSVMQLQWNKLFRISGANCHLAKVSDFFSEIVDTLLT